MEIMAESAARHTQVTDNVSLASILLRDLGASFNLVEKERRRELEEVGEKVETSSMGHS